MNQQKNTADLLEQISCKEKYYCCESISGQYRYITTNDNARAKKLIDAGGTVLCHPEFFSAIFNYQNGAEQLVPVVIRQVCTRQENSDQDRHAPTDRCESALAKLY